MCQITLKVKKLFQNTTLPAYAHEGDAAMDLTGVRIEYDAENDAYIYDTGLVFETRKGVAAFIMPRSSIYKTNFYLANSIGLIDTATYRGHVKIVFKHRDSLHHRIEYMAQSNWHTAMDEYNELPWYTRMVKKAPKYSTYFDNARKLFEEDPIKYAPYKPGERCAQLIVAPLADVIIKPITSVSETDRGEGGFGSTGK